MSTAAQRKPLVQDAERSPAALKRPKVDPQYFRGGRPKGRPVLDLNDRSAPTLYAFVFIALFFLLLYFFQLFVFIDRAKSAFYGGIDDVKTAVSLGEDIIYQVIKNNEALRK